MLMYVSKSWLAELYQHVLITNILILSGYKTQSTGHLALIDLLTGSYGVSLRLKLNFICIYIHAFLICLLCFVLFFSV